MSANQIKYLDDSRDSLFVKHTKKCWNNELVVEVVPTPSKHCKINVLHKGKIIVQGEKYYSQQPTTGGSPLQLKVSELYEHYYNKITEKENRNARKLEKTKS